MKFKEYVEGVNKMLKEHPEYGEMEMGQRGGQMRKSLCRKDLRMKNTMTQISSICKGNGRSSPVHNLLPL